MSRTSKDEYMLPDGRVICLWQDQEPPHGAKIWNGYDYENQCWVYQGKRDERSLEQLVSASSNR